MRHKEPSTIVGLDVGDRTTQVWAIAAGSGEVQLDLSVSTTKAAVRRILRDRDRCRVVLEAGTHSRWLSELIEDLGHEALVANPRKLRLIYADTNKSDRLDARRLARLGLHDASLLYPVRHRARSTHEDLAVIKARDQLVSQRAAIVLKMRGMVKSSGERLSRCATENFARTVRDEIPEGLRPALEPLRQTLGALDAAIAEYDALVEKLARERYPETLALTTVPGVGTLTALAYVLTLEDPCRFRKSRDVGPALGLVPRRDQSGDRDLQLRITKAGDDYLRRLLVEAAHCIVRDRSPDSDLKRWAQARAERGGAIARKRAIVAVARKLAVLLHRLWVTGESYRPLKDEAA